MSDYAWRCIADVTSCMAMNNYASRMCDVCRSVSLREIHDPTARASYFPQHMQVKRQKCSCMKPKSMYIDCIVCTASCMKSNANNYNRKQMN